MNDIKHVITKYAQSTVLVELKGCRLLIDPGVYNFEPNRLSRETLPDADLLIVTHAHADHYDQEAIALLWSRCRPTILTTHGIREELQKQGIPAELFADNTRYEHSSGVLIAGTSIEHVVNGEKVDGFGVLISAQGQSIYYASDTTYIEKKPLKPSLLLVPINNRGLCLSIDEAVQFTEEVMPKCVIPVHYDSPKDAGKVDPHEFVTKVRAKLPDTRAEVLGFGDRMVM